MTGIKARIFAMSLLDMAIDIVVPLLVYVLLTALGVTTYLALAAGGILVAGKAGLGRIAEWRAGRRLGFVATTAVVALAVTFVLAASGLPDVVAAAVGGVIVAVPVVTMALGGGRVDGFGLLVLVEIVASFAITLISDDPRFVLARPAIYTAIAGVYMFVSCVGRRPLMLDATKPVAMAGDPVRGQAFENAWLNSPRFRTIERLMTAGLGVVLLLESVLRVVIVYSAPKADVVEQGLASQLPAIALLVVYVLAVRLLAVPRLRAVVDGEYAALVTQDPVPPSR